MERVFTRAALPFPPPHTFIPPAVGFVSSQSTTQLARESIFAKWGWHPQIKIFQGQWARADPLPPSDCIHGRNRKARDSKYCKESALLNESQCAEKGAVTFMMKTVAARSDSWASSHSTPITPLSSSCFVRFSARLEFVPGSLLQDTLATDWISMIVFVWVGHSFCALTGRAKEKWCF